VPVEPLSEPEAMAVVDTIGLPQSRARQSVYRVLLNNPAFAKASHDMLGALFNSAFDQRLRELIILRVAWVRDCSYEWAQHWRRSTEPARVSPTDVASSPDRYAIDPAELLAVRDWESYDFGPTERAILRATDEMLSVGSVSPQTLRSCEEAFPGDPETVVEIVATIGFWTMMSSLINSFAIEHEDDLELWPPDGCGPRN
jgi:alkylhydroperoxidase family enzyme